MTYEMNIRDIRYLKNKYEGVQLKSEELLLIAKAILKYPVCNFLVFGLGYDSPLWLEINKGGRTVFLEDNREWFDRITGSYPDLEAYFVTFPTKITQWQDLLDKPNELEIPLPVQVTNIHWDVILVDAPSGAYCDYYLKYGTEPPGRMISIYMASKLIKSDGDVFVHDCHRIVEKVYADHYLFDKNFVKQIGKKTILRHYKG